MLRRKNLFFSSKKNRKMGSMIDDLEKKLEFYKQEIIETSNQIANKNGKSVEMVCSGLRAQGDNIFRMSVVFKIKDLGNERTFRPNTEHGVSVADRIRSEHLTIPSTFSVPSKHSRKAMEKQSKVKKRDTAKAISKIRFIPLTIKKVNNKVPSRTLVFSNPDDENNWIGDSKKNRS